MKTRKEKNLPVGVTKVDRLKVEAREGKAANFRTSRVRDWMPSFGEIRRSRAVVHGKALRHTTLKRDHTALKLHILPEMGSTCD